MVSHVARSRIQVFLIFAIIGPLIGSVPFAVMLFVAGLRDPTGPALGLMAFIFGFPIGVVPAAVAGVVFVALSSAPLLAHVSQRRFLVFSLGALAGLIGGIALAGIIVLTASPRPGVLVMLLLPSAISGGCSALISMQSRPVLLSVGRWCLAALALAVFLPS
jgi:hypothetical protein